MIDAADSRCGRAMRARSAARCWKSWATAATTWAHAVSEPAMFCARYKNDETNLHGIQPGLDSTAALASALMLRRPTVRRQGRGFGEPALAWLWRSRRHLRFLGRTRLLATAPYRRKSWLRSGLPAENKKNCGKPTFVGIGGRPWTGLACAPPTAPRDPETACMRLCRHPSRC